MRPITRKRRLDAIKKLVIECGYQSMTIEDWVVWINARLSPFCRIKNKYQLAQIFRSLKTDTRIHYERVTKVRKLEGISISNIYYKLGVRF